MAAKWHLIPSLSVCRWHSVTLCFLWLFSSCSLGSDDLRTTMTRRCPKATVSAPIILPTETPISPQVSTRVPFQSPHGHHFNLMFSFGLCPGAGPVVTSPSPEQVQDHRGSWIRTSGSFSVCKRSSRRLLSVSSLLKHQFVQSHDGT